MSYLLDTNIVSYFLQCRREGELASAAANVSLAMVDEVRVELEADPQRGPAFKKWFSRSNIEPLAIALGSPAHETYAELVVGISSPRGRGERASIALAAQTPKLVFVAHDKGALWIALRELYAPGERIIGLAVLLRRLCEDGGLPLAAAQAVLAVSQSPKPSWWAAWVASRTQP